MVVTRCLHVLTALVVGWLIVLDTAAQQPPPPSPIAIVGGQVIDGTDRAPIPDGVVVIEGNKIRAIGPRGTTMVPQNARIIHADGQTVLPGLADVHTHSAYFNANPRDFEDDALAGLRAASIMREAIDAGITLARDMGAPHYVAIGLKQAIAKGYVEGPRLLVCNNIVGVTGAHGTESELMLPPKILLESDSPEEWRKNIRHNFKMGADFTKVTTPFTAEEIRVAIEETHNFGARIAVHASGHVYPSGLMSEHAVAAGADTIEHLYPMKNEAKVLAMMQKQGTIVVPTLNAARRFSGRWDAPNDEDVRWQVTQKDFEGRFKRMHAANIKMAIGTDTGGKDGGQIGVFYRRELELFMQWGYSAHEAIQAATHVGAEAAGRSDILGTLEAGKLADLIVVPGDPLKDIALVNKPVLVMKDGIVLRNRMSKSSS
jgi:imidazolonepropionase-like amidohydrolase